MDRLVAAAQQYPGTIEIRMRKHLGLNHQKTVWFHSQRVVVFGTSNWSDASDDNQLEANIFTDKMPGDPLNDFLFDELYKVFERKWNNLAPVGAIETEAWRTPTLPPPTEPTTCQDPARPIRRPAAVHLSAAAAAAAAAAAGRGDRRRLSGERHDHRRATGRCCRRDRGRRLGDVESESRSGQSGAAAGGAGELRRTDVRCDEPAPPITSGCGCGRRTTRRRTTRCTSSSMTRSRRRGRRRGGSARRAPPSSFSRTARRGGAVERVGLDR